MQAGRGWAGPQSGQVPCCTCLAARCAGHTPTHRNPRKTREDGGGRGRNVPWKLALPPPLPRPPLAGSIRPGTTSRPVLCRTCYGQYDSSHSASATRGCITRKDVRCPSRRPSSEPTNRPSAHASLLPYTLPRHGRGRGREIIRPRTAPICMVRQLRRPCRAVTRYAPSYTA